MSKKYPRSFTPQKKIIMEPKNGGLEDDVPFQADDFQVQNPLIFQGVQGFLLQLPATLPETNIAPENRPKRPKRKLTRIPTMHFQVQTCC